MRRIRFLLLVLPLAAASCFAQADSDVASCVTVLASPDARATGRMRLVRELSHVISALHVSPQRLPNIVVVYAGDDSARIDALPAGAKVTVVRITLADGVFYQVWITGEASDASAVQGLIWVLNRHYDLRLPEARIAEVRDGVLRQMSAVVSVDALAGKHR